MLSPLALADPRSATRWISEDPSLKAWVRLDDGRKMTALDLQEALWDASEAYGDVFGWDSVGGDTAGKMIMHEWRRAIDLLRRDPGTMKFELDWVARKHLMDVAIQRCGPNDPRVGGYVRSYGKCAADPKISMFARLPMRELIADDDIRLATARPPRSTRAALRVAMLNAPDAVAGNWDAVYATVNGQTVRYVLPPGPAIDRSAGSVNMTGASAGEIYQRYAGRYCVEPANSRIPLVASTPWLA